MKVLVGARRCGRATAAGGVGAALRFDAVPRAAILRAVEAPGVGVALSADVVSGAADSRTVARRLGR